MQDAVGAGSGPGRFVDLPVVGRGEDAAGDGGIEHALSDESAVQGFVAGAAPRDEADAPAWVPVAGCDVERLFVEADQVRVGQGQAPQGLFHCGVFG
ncbi:hypothetical protein GCM10009548_74340 [Streptomyces malaysiensis subsp. malaysiensis]